MMFKITVFNQKGKIFSGADKGPITISLLHADVFRRMLATLRLILSTTEPEPIQ